MDIQQSNPYQQAPLSNQPTAQPTPEPTKSNKLWPIDWRHNTFIKIADTTLFFGVIIISVFTIILILWGIVAPSPMEPNFTPSNFIKINSYFRILNSASLVLFIFSFFVFILSVIKFKSLDKFEKIFLFAPIFSFIVLTLVSLLQPFCCLITNPQ